MVNSEADNTQVPRILSCEALPKRAVAFGGSTIAAARFLLLCSFLLCFPVRLTAQYLGNVGIQTVSQTLFATGTACTGSPQTAVVANLGQTSHQIYMTIGGASMTAVTFFLEGSSDGINFTRISDENDGSVNASLSTSGYSTVVRANITCSPGTSTFGMTYSGSGVPPTQPQGDGLRAQMEKVLVANTNAATDQNGSFRTPYGNLSGLLKVNVGTAAGSPTFNVTCQFAVLAFNSVQTFSLVTGINNIVISATPCAVATWTYSHGTSSGSFSAEYVFSAGFSGSSGTGGGSNNVAGCVPDGTSVGTCNPVTVGGKTSPGSSSPGVAKFATVLGENANDLSVGNYNVLGVAVGAGNINPQGTTTGTTLPNVGPLGAAITGVRTDAATGTNQPLNSTPAGGFSYGVNTAGSANNSGPGLLVNDNGFSFLSTSVTISASGNQVVENTPPWNFGTLDQCRVSVTTGTPTGTTPTLDVYFQDSLDGTNFSDRLHFAQITTTASTQKQTGAVSANTVNGVTPLTAAPIQIQSQTIAVSTIVNGPIAGWLRFSFVIGGTTPSFPTVQFGVVCH